jgi:predicted unusual protein kinase regulating ubiquinone biosynthesis (AarF/ABC1/UbiB family)
LPIRPSSPPSPEAGNYTNGRTAASSTTNGALNDSAPLNGRGVKPPVSEPAPSADAAFVSDVPFDMDDIPRPRSLRLQVRFLRGVVFAAWLFVRAIFWFVYVKRYLPDYIEQSSVKRWQRYAREYRGFATSMGGVFIKLGQFMSTRVDIIPETIVNELRGLQDEVPTLDFKVIRRVLDQELGSIERRFEWIEETPIAAASLGQAHRAKLHTGERVVIKIQRPRIREICYTDLATVRIVSRVAGRIPFIARRANTVGLVREFGAGLLEELSYYHEARNARRFYEIFKNDMGVYIPEIHLEHSTDHVLTMEDVTSLKLNEPESLVAAGISPKDVAKRLMDTYLTMIFEQRVFHADPHPGNLFIYPLPVDDVQPYVDRGGGRPFYLIFIDFGMTGRLTREITEGIVSTLGAVVSRDPDRLVDSYAKLGFILPGADLRRIKEAAKAAFDAVWGMNMSELREQSFEDASRLAFEFNDLIKSMPFYLPQDFIYLGRTVSILSGMATSLDPTFNPWHEIEPYTRKLISNGFLGADAVTRQTSAPALIGDTVRGALKEVMRATTPINPTLQLIEELRSGDLRVTSDPSYSYKLYMARMESRSRAQSRAILFGAALIASAVFYVNGEVMLAGAGALYCAGSALYGWLRGS